MTPRGISPSAVETFTARERARFIAQNPKSVALAERAQHSLFGGVPMHWMADWSTPNPLFVSRAKGARFYDVDGHEYIDFCLGDTGTDSNRYVLRWARAITERKVLLVFDGCYHGTVDDVMVRCHDGETQPRSGLIGQAYDLTQYSRSIPFNDVDALEAALAKGDVAALMCEPAMTNIGMVLPEPGFMQKCRELTQKYGSLLIIDETHTISTGMGGCTQLWNLEPDFFVVGKPIAGGVPCGIFGCSAAMADAMQAARQRASAGNHGHGHSGMGTTLSANALAMHCMRANLEQVMTQAAYDHMLPLAKRLADGFRSLIRKYELKWSVTELGARSEFQFCPQSPKTGAEAEAAFHDELQMALHLYLINRGILITPFHNMTLCCPATSAADEALGELLAIPGARE